MDAQPTVEKLEPAQKWDGSALHDASTGGYFGDPVTETSITFTIKLTTIQTARLK